ncbi:MAG: PAS domain S-box protein [Candidatus Marinimicrobia bacterium]|nr:PAS domain S-box protein [Candidatus Neomarinimicrobiota bacterium]
MNFDEYGGPIGLSGTIRDITERKQAEEKKQLLADMLEIIPASITIHDFDGNFLYFNNRTLEIHGYTKDEFKSLNLHKLDTPTSEKLIAQRMQVLRETGEASFEAVHSRKDRSTVPVFVHVKRTKWKDKEVLLSVAIDITERKQAEAALTQSEERHRTLFETMAQGVVYQRADGHIISANPAAERILGLTLDQMLGRTSIDPRWKSIHEDGSDFPGDTHPAMVALRTKKEVRNEIMGVFHPDENEYVWININAIPNIKQPYQVYTTFEDITERKVAEGKIKRFSRIFEDSLNEIYLFNSETLKFIQVNNAAQQNLGYTMEELRNMTPLNFKPEFTLESFEKLITPLRKRKKGKINFETVHKRKDNSLYNVEVHLQLLKYEHEEIFAAIIMDITERKQAEEELQESELQYRTLGETIPYGVWTTDATGYCTYVSDSFIELVDMRLDQIQEFGWLHLLPPEDVEQTKEHWLDCVKTGKNFERVHSFRSKDGSYRNVLAIGRPIKDKNDKIRKWVGINLDITDRQQVAEERKQALKDAQNANNVKDLFLANMSHELRTPLNSLLGFTEIVEDSLKDRVSEEEAEFFQTIRHSGKRLIKTIHGVLDISQIETGTILFSQEIMPLAPTVEQLYKEFKPLAEAKKLKLTFDNQIDGGCIKADESLLIKAVSNIVENAIKYTDKGEIALKLIEQVGHYGLSISDTGIGMSADYMKHMYDTFTQESSGFTKKYQGLGLGLSIAKRCLDLMEIAIDVESKKGVGTTFKLTFKREEVDDDTLDKPVEAKPKVIEAIDIEKPMVLIVEDDKNNRKVLEVQLKPTYHTCYAVSVDGAMQQLKQHNVDLVLLDLALEGEATGLDLVAYMKTKDKLKDIPIIAVTAHTFTIDRENALNAGCDAYFSKPIKMMELKEMINEYCKK